MPSALLPELISPVVQGYLSGDSDSATESYNSILPLINFENRQCGLRAAKTAMKEGGLIQHDRVRHPLEELHPETKLQLIKYGRELDILALRWGK